MATVKFGEVVIDTSIYPREKWNTNTIKMYADALKGGAKFPPIILEEGTNRLIDGLHRLRAHQQYLQEYQEYQAQLTLEGIERDGWEPAPDVIEVEYCTIPEGIPPKLYAASFSTRHGDKIPTAERKAIAREIFEENPDFTLELISQYLDVSKSSAGDYVSDIRARRREQQKMIAYRLHRLGWTQQEVAEAIGISQPTYSEQFLSEFPGLENPIKKLLTDGIPHLDIAERFNMPLILVWAIDLQGRTDAQRMERLGIKVQPYDVWNFSKCGDLFGFQHPGRIPGELIAHILYFFTEPGAKVIDPMAGGGTTLDVCLAFGRECYAYDIDQRHNRPDIIQHDLTRPNEDKQYWPERIKKADLIFWDPPYFEKMDKKMIGDTGYIEGSISALDREGFLSFFSDRLSEAKALVKKGTKLAFLMSDWDDETGERDGIFLWDYANVIQSSGWKLIRHIQAPLSTQQVHPDIVNKFRKSRRLARLERYLLVAEA
jgi:DNA modification methylase